MADLDDALAAIRRGDDANARARLIAAWRARRSAALADLVELIDERSPDELHARLGEIVRPKVATTEERLRAISATDDPRLSRWAIDALVDPPFQSKSAEGLLAEIVRVAARDPRLRDRRFDIIPVLVARIGNVPMRNRLIEAVDAAIRALVPVPAAGAGDLALEAEIAAALEPLRARERSIDALLADIYANPADDAPRLVYADLLLQHEDPRGELIRLQLERGRGGAISDRERWLVKQHGRDWLGALVAVLSFGKGYANTTFERGFVSCADVILSVGKRLALVLDAPEWATVESLQGPWTMQLLATAPLRALRAVDGMLTARDIVALAARAEPLAALAAIDVHATQLVAGEDELLDPSLVRRAFPGLQALRVFYDAGATPSPADVARIARFAPHRLVVDRHWTQLASQHATGLAHHQELVGALVGARASVAELAVQPPWHARPKPAAVELRRAPSGVFVPA